MILSQTSLIGHHHKITNITWSSTSLSSNPRITRSRERQDRVESVRDFQDFVGPGPDPVPDFQIFLALVRLEIFRFLFVLLLGPGRTAWSWTDPFGP